MKFWAAIIGVLWAASAHAYFPWLPPHAALPTSATCIAEIPTTPETVPANATANAAYPNAAQLNAFWAQPNGDVQGPGWEFLPNADWAGVKGGYAYQIKPAVPSTDMIIRWAACKWGIDENALRAQAWEESTWNQGTLGDYGTGLSYCSADGGAFTALYQPATNDCYASHSIIQMRLVPNGFWTMYPQVINSTGFALDAMGAMLRGCINGDMNEFFGGSYLAQYESDQVNNLPALYANCQGEHYSGNYGDAAALSYEAALAMWESQQPWLSLP